jgi:hypothetical protein
VSTTTIIVIVLVLLVLGGGGGYGYYTIRSSTGGPVRVSTFNPTYGIGGVLVTLLVLWVLLHYLLHVI